MKKSQLKQIIKEEIRKVLNEISITSPGKITSNSQLYRVLNSNIRQFAKQELETESSLLTHTFDSAFSNYDWDNDPENFGDEDYTYNTEFDDMPQHIQQFLINYLAEAGLIFDGEWKSEEDEKYGYGISWNLTDLGIVYNWTDEADPGSYSWGENSFRGYKFYELHYNI